LACQCRGSRPYRCRALRGECAVSAPRPAMGPTLGGYLAPPGLAREAGARFPTAAGYRPPAVEKDTCLPPRFCPAGGCVKGDGFPLESGLECPEETAGHCPAGKPLDSERPCARGIAPRRVVPLPESRATESSWGRVDPTHRPATGFAPVVNNAPRKGEETVKAAVMVRDARIAAAREPGGVPWAPGEPKGVRQHGERRPYTESFPRFRSFKLRGEPCLPEVGARVKPGARH